ncbi:NPCBM/NEW2 domain-containing protein, partial [Thomasclavelia sp.]
MIKRIGKGLLAVFLCISCIANVNIFSVGAKTDDVIIDVTEFGADPSGKNDSTEAVKNALKRVKEVNEETDKTVVVNFPKGEYHFWKDYATKRKYHTSNTSSLSNPEKSIAILLEDVKNVMLEGNDSSFIMHGDMMALAVVESKNVTLHGFTLDYKDADTVDISVVENGQDANGNDYTDFYIPANYNYKISSDKRNITWQGDISPITGQPYWEKQSANFCAYLVIYKGYDQTVARASDKPASNPFSNVTNIEKNGENVVRFTYASGQRPKDQEVGNIFLLSDSAGRKTTGAFFWESEDLLVDSIDVHYLSGFGWLTQMCKNVEFKNVDFLPRFGTGKYTTSNADQLHVAGCGGYFKVTDCNFSMAHDDPINVHGSYMRVEEVIDDKTLKVKYIHSQQGGFRQFHKGDEVLFYSRTYLEPPAGESEDKPYIVKSSIAPGEEYNGNNLDKRTEIVTFEESFSEETLNDLRIKVTRNNSTAEEGLYVAENVTYTPEVTISGNHMKSIPTRGILCTTRKPVIIENNTFDNMAMANIYLSNDADYWYESGPIRNMTIRNNKFYIRSTGQAEWGNVSGIFVDPVVLKGVSGAPGPKGDTPVHRNITIESNEFHMGNDNVVTATGVDGVKILNNKIIRDNADIKIQLNVSQSIGIGETQEINAVVSENSLSKDVFKFTNCKNVEIGGNVYDDGLNLNVTTSGANMTEADLTVNDNVLTLNKAGGNLITSASKVKYITSDPSIAYIDEQGQLKGIKDGKVTLLAYAQWNGTIIKSNEVEVTVGQGSGSLVNVSIDKNVVAEGEQVDLTYTEGATIELIDPITGETSDNAKVTGNIYTALKEGVVIVKATKNGKSTSVLVTNNFEKSYGNLDYLNDNVKIDNINKNNLSGNKDEITITAQTGSELYGGSTHVNNLVKFAIPQEYKNDLRVQVDVKGLPVLGDGYNNAGIILYKDGNNYYSVGKKGHMSGVTAVYEVNASPSERSGNSNDNKLENTTLELEIINNVATFKYKDGNGQWKVANTQSNISNITSGDIYLALCAWQNTGRNFSTNFGNIKMAKASETTTDNMDNVEAKQIFNSFENAQPIVKDVKLTVNGVNSQAKVTASLQDSDGEISQVIYQWVLKDSDGNIKAIDYSTKGSYIPKVAGILQVNVTAVDKYGKPSQIVSSNEEEVLIDKSLDNELKHLYINGNLVSDLKNKNIDFVLPEGISSKIRVSYDLENTGVKTVIKNSKGEILAELIDKNEAIIDISQDSKIIIERGNVTYNVQLHTQFEGITTIDELSINGEIVNLIDDEIRVGTNSYFKRINSDDAVIKLCADKTVKSITATNSFFAKNVTNESNEEGVFEANVDLTAGINAFYIKVTGADGISERIVRLYIFRDGFNDSTLNNLKVNGEVINGFDPAINDYTIYADKEDGEITIDAIPNSDEQTTSITKDNQRNDSSKATYKLNSGLNQIIVANKSENMWDVSYYTLNVVVRSNDNADLLNLSTDEKLSPEFNGLKPNVNDYTIVMNKDSLHLNAQSQMDNAKIIVSSGDQRIEAVGRIDTNLTIYEGKNTVKIQVIAPDQKTTKTYTLNVVARGLVYASDVMDLATKQVVGYGQLQLDKASSGSVIALVDQNGQRIEFAKGLGAHAQSEIAYNIEGQGFETFESFVGIDYYQVSQGDVPSSVTFRVVVDGEEKFNSGVMTVKTPMQKVIVDIKNAKTIQLFADMGANNYNDHADWADACFTKSLGQAPEQETNKLALQVTVESAKAVSEETLNSVVPAVANEFRAALAEAELILADPSADQTTIDTSFYRLAHAIQMLDFIKGDKGQLEALIKSCENYAEANYTAESWVVLQNALTAANKVMEDENALEYEVTDALNDLNDA